MKFLVVLGVFAIAFSGEAEAFFSKGGGEFKAHISGGSGGHGLENILAIPLQFKTKIIQAKRAKINSVFDALEGALGKFSGGLGGAGAGGFGGSSSGAVAESGSFGGSTSGSFGGSTGGSESISIGNSGAGAGAGSGSFGGSTSGSGSFGGSSSVAQSGSVSAGGSFGGSGSVSNAGSSAFTGGEQIYHPQPAANAQYQQQPIVVYLYQHAPAQPAQGLSASNAHAHVEQTYQPAPVQTYQPEPAPCNHGPAPVQTYQPEPVQTYQPEPAPVQTFGSGSSAGSASVSVNNEYLPPYGNGHDASHY